MDKNINIADSRFRWNQWKMLLLTMFCYLFFYTGRHNFGWAAKGMAADLHISLASVGWISFSMLIGYATGQLINGNLADRFSPKIMVVAGAYLSVLMNILVSFSHNYTLIFILWAFNGYFQSLAWAPGSKVISNWWRKEERGSAFGFYTMAAGSSSAITYLLSIIILEKTNQWQNLFRIPVLFLLFAATVYLLFAKSCPSDVGFDNLYTEDKAVNSNTTWKERYRAVFSNKKFMIATIAIGFESMARYGLIVWLPVHYLGSNYKNSSGILWSSLLMPVGMALGALSFGKISQSWFTNDRPKSIMWGMLIAALMSLFIYFVPVNNTLMIGLIIFASGFFVYGPQACFWPISSDILGENHVATGIGIMNMSAYLFAACGEPLIGWVIDKTGHSSNVFLVITLICLLSSFTISKVKILQKG